MKDTKLIRLLRTFSRVEWKEFEKFAASQYFNKGRNYISLIKEIKKFSPEFNSANLTKEYLYKKIYPGKPVKKSVMNTINSGLFALAEEFIMHSHLQKSDYYRKLLLLESYSDRSEFSGFFECIRQLHKITDTEVIQHNLFTDKSFVESSYASYYQQKNDEIQKQQIHLVNRGNYIVMDLLLRLPQVLNDTQYSATLYNLEDSEVISTSFARNFNFEKFITDIADTDFKYINAARVCSLISYLCIHENDYQNFIKAKNLYIKHFNEFDSMYQYIFGLLLSNYAARNRTVIKEVFAQETLAMWDFMLEKNVFFGVYGTFIPHKPFIEYVNSACECDSLVKAGNFIEKYSGLLHPAKREHSVNRCLAVLSIIEGNPGLAIELVKNFQPKDIFDKIDLKRILCMAYYELGYEENLEYTILASLKMINDNKFVSDIRGRDYITFFKYIKKISNLTQTKNDDEFTLLKKELMGEKYFMFHFWIKDKIDQQLKKNKSR